MKEMNFLKKIEKNPEKYLQIHMVCDKLNVMYGN